ncbi:polyprenyl synthetase family protein [Streptomyces peucetius]|uniref:Polyprenyl synthetase family protein n=1 Tax=Streptomyces peucetius TaxID=1950 RepID=A0ABY6IBL1_STRPE|nr:polyprenyl synthetase family protein [Streptomyces peucetius]UYQ64383.1 polyprenyl synthetase family protein [Streptomyces peucetius]
MASMSYLDLHQKFAADIEAETEIALERLGPAAGELRNAVTGLLRNQKFTYPLSVLPLLVHGAETGVPGPAVPLAVVHDLWWTSACYLDDVADGNTSIVAGGAMGANEALLASVVTGHVLPLSILRSLRVPEEIRAVLTTEALSCATAAAEGQLADMRGDAAGATRASVLAAYRGKSSAPFRMIMAMAATLAEADTDRTETWRGFGDVFGVLWQLFNDQEDMLTGRDEDLRNGTVTYLFACALDGGSPAPAERLLSLHAAAPASHAARRELAGLLRAPTNLDRFRRDVDAFRESALRLLGELGGDKEYLPVLADLVDRSSRVML